MGVMGGGYGHVMEVCVPGSGPMIARSLVWCSHRYALVSVVRLCLGVRSVSGPVSLGCAMKGKGLR